MRFVVDYLLWDCTDTEGWTNNHGFTCADYASKNWCTNGAFVASNAWTGDEKIGAECSTPDVPSATYPTCADYYNYPGRNCIACGKPCTSGKSIIIFIFSSICSSLNIMTSLWL